MGNENPTSLFAVSTFLTVIFILLKLFGAVSITWLGAFVPVLLWGAMLVFVLLLTGALLIVDKAAKG